jgi:hypothetical protein
MDDVVDNDEELPNKEGCDGDEILDVGCCFISHPFSSLISSMIDHPWLAKVLALEHESPPSPPLGAWLLVI